MQGELKDEAAVSGTQLWLVLMKAFHAVSSFSAGTLKESGLGESDFRVLEVLLHKGPLPVNTLGPKVHLTPGSISTAVDRLFERGLVTRKESREDRRVRVVDLTPEGKRLIKTVFAAHKAEMDGLGEVLNGKERRQLARGLKVLGKAAAARDKRVAR